MMLQLRELSMAIDGRDWVRFPHEQLPNAGNLRALHINKMNDQWFLDLPDLLARKLMDMVSIMPHLSLSNFQIADNRYEIVEVGLADYRDEATESDAECDFTPINWGSHAWSDDEADSSDRVAGKIIILVKLMRSRIHSLQRATRIILLWGSKKRGLGGKSSSCG
ncbi:uncharacterized protein ACHE_80371S [Aspergillus chevalieri]|uniref:Uncharacterized protein n=1 Tax=Aspergillus chevalieri TaxID=182096 RepID=A0A7R7VXA8_ASPCH|nr:uncharacterized protein ACHE_80371S [Aspergillus chevalieri]BCR92471.1 hypothetical protein ACHE_80371S [Aspergillus chevalieri]